MKPFGKTLTTLCEVFDILFEYFFEQINFSLATIIFQLEKWGRSNTYYLPSRCHRNGLLECIVKQKRFESYQQRSWYDRRKFSKLSYKDKNWEKKDNWTVERKDTQQNWWWRHDYYWDQNATQKNRNKHHKNMVLLGLRSNCFLVLIQYLSNIYLLSSSATSAFSVVGSSCSIQVVSPHTRPIWANIFNQSRWQQITDSALIDWTILQSRDSALWYKHVA